MKRHVIKVGIATETEPRAVTVRGPGVRVPDQYPEPESLQLRAE